MSTQATSPTIDLDDFAGGMEGARRSARNPTTQELLEAFMKEGSPPSGGASNGSGAAKLYRGRSTAELIPKIQAELGPQAVVTARRSGLEGGIGGFFQRPFVEIEAQEGHARVDIRDGEDALPPLPDSAPRAAHLQPEALRAAPPARSFTPAPRSFTPAPRSFTRAPRSFTAAPESLNPAPRSFTTAPERFTKAPESFTTAPASFAAALDDAEAPAGPAPSALVTEPTLTSLPRCASPNRSKARDTVLAELGARGFSEPFAAALLDEAAMHVLPFTPRIGLRRAVRVALERRIPRASALSRDGASIALLGPGGAGKSACQSALAARYQRGGVPITAASIVLDPEHGSLQLIAPPAIGAVAADSKRARAALDGARAQGIVLLDTPALSPADKGALKALAQALGTLMLDRIVVVLPATMSAGAMASVLRASAQLSPSAVAITHVEESEELGVAIEVACGAGLAPEYLLRAARGELAINPTDPGAIAHMLLP